MSSLPSWLDTDNVTSSPASEDGPTPCDSQDGRTIVRSMDRKLSLQNAQYCCQEATTQSEIGGHTGANLSAAAAPTIIFSEQVAVVKSWFDIVCNDLEDVGYDIGAAILPAVSVG